MISFAMAATFGWLCVETNTALRGGMSSLQPPSGGCVLKPVLNYNNLNYVAQPPSGGCVLKHQYLIGNWLQ